ncbi:MAG: CotH kinase family protein [Bacteroidia bacterium]
MNKRNTLFLFMLLLTSIWSIAQTSTLPLIVIATENNAGINDEPKVTAQMGIIDNGPDSVNRLTDDYNDYEGKIGIEVRGASSQLFPKKGYGFETRLPDGSNNNVSLLGMPEENDWVLHGPYSDKSLLRNVLAYHIGEETGEYSPKTRLCELYINSDYRGVYMLTEKIKRDKNRVDISKLKPEDITGEELTGGYILQIDRDDGSTSNDGWWSNSSPSKFYAHHYPAEDDLVPAQREYIKTYITSFEDAMQSANYENEYLNYVDRTSWINYFLATEIGKHIDAFKLSFYMHKRKSTDGGKLHFGPLWDFNLGFGNFNFVCSPDPEGWTYQFQGTCDNSHPFWVKKMTDIPEVSHLTNCRWQELRKGPWHTDSLLQFIDDRLLEMGDAPERNFNKWDVLGKHVWPNDYVGDTYDEEVTFLKTWLTQRLTWMDNNMIGDCSLASTQETIYQKTPFSVFPNPTQDYVYIESHLSNNQNNILKIYNSVGSEVGTFDISKNVNKIDVSRFSQGMYILKFQNNSGELSCQKLIIR